MTRDVKRLPDAELAVMQALWACEAPAGRSDLEGILQGTHPMAATTLLTLLSRLADKGFVRSEKLGRSARYTPLVSQEDYLAFDSRAVLDRLYGSPKNFVAALASRGLERGELEELQALLDQLKGRRAP